MSVNIIFKYHCVLIGKYIFVIFFSLFVIRHFRGTCSSSEMLNGYMTRESLETSALDHDFTFIKLLQFHKIYGAHTFFSPFQR